VARTAGVQSEMELAFAGLHPLVAPVRDHLANLPEPEREALQTAFGFTAGPARDATRTARMWGECRSSAYARFSRVAARAHGPDGGVSGNAVVNSRCVAGAQ